MTYATNSLSTNLSAPFTISTNVRKFALIPCCLISIILPLFAFTSIARASQAAQDDSTWLGDPASIQNPDEDDLMQRRGLLFEGCGGEIVAPTNFELEQMVVEITNRERAANGLPPFKLNPQLSDAARYHSADMFQDGYFEHDSYDRNGNSHVLVCSTWDRILVYYPSPRAENIAAGYRTPENVMTGWMNSPGHRRNIMGDFWEIGVGFYEFYWNQDFGTRSGVYPLIVDAEAIRTDSAQVSLYMYGNWQEMRVQNDGGAWGNWQPFQTESSWTLNATPGLRTVTMEVRNGSSSYMASDTIEYNGPAGPTPAPPTPVPPTPVPPTPVPPTPVPPTPVPTEVPPTPTPAPTEVPPTPMPAPTEVPPTQMPAPTEVPPTEIPPTEVPATETATPIQTVTQAPITETPVSETPVSETPVSETPVSETPVAATPTVEAPTTEIPPTATASPTNEPTRLPGETVTLRGRVTLEGRPPAPDARWETWLQVNLHAPFTGDLVASYSATTAADGTFEVSGITPDIYQIGVKGSHTLQVGARVNLRSGDADIDFGQLLEGDATGDDVVNLRDFSVWRRHFNQCIGGSGYEPKSDFDQSGCTDFEDFWLLAKNFGLQGSLDGDRNFRGEDDFGANIQPVTTIRNKKAGELFRMTIQLNSDAMANGMTANFGVLADSSAIHLRYTPRFLRAIDIQGHPRFETILQKNLDDALGHVDFAAAALDSAAVVEGTLATVTFEVLADFEVQDINMVLSGPNATDIAYAGESLIVGEATTQTFVTGVQEINLSPTLFVPLVSY